MNILALVRFFFPVAMQAQAVTLGWWVYELTRDPLHLGLIGLAEAIPAIGFALFAGHWVDRGAPFRILRAAILCAAFVLVVLSIVTGAADLPVSTQLGLAYGAVVISGTARAFISPSMFSILPRLVPREQLAQASARMGVAFQGACILGPLAAGAGCAILGASRTLGLAVFSAGMASFVLHFLPAPVRRFKNETSREPALQAITKGLKFVFSHPIILPALTLDLFSVLFGGAHAILPAFCAEVLDGDASAFGMLRAAPAVGALVVNITLVRSKRIPITGKLLLICVAGFGVSILLFGISKTAWMAALGLLFSGGFDAVSMVTRSTLLQFSTPDEMRGRVSAVNSIFIASSNEIGAFESGVAAKLMGLVPSILFGGFTTLGIVSVAALKAKTLRGYRMEHGR